MLEVKNRSRQSSDEGADQADRGIGMKLNPNETAVMKRESQSVPYDAMGVVAMGGHSWPRTTRKTFSINQFFIKKLFLLYKHFGCWEFRTLLGGWRGRNGFQDLVESLCLGKVPGVSKQCVSIQHVVERLFSITRWGLTTEVRKTEYEEEFNFLRIFCVLFENGSVRFGSKTFPKFARRVSEQIFLISCGKFSRTQIG